MELTIFKLCCRGARDGQAKHHCTNRSSVAPRPSVLLPPVIHLSASVSITTLTCLPVSVCLLHQASVTHTHTHTAPHPIITTPKKLQCSCIQQDTAVHFYPTCISPLHPSTRTSIHPFGSPSSCLHPSIHLPLREKAPTSSHPPSQDEGNFHPSMHRFIHPSLRPTWGCLLFNQLHVRGEVLP